MLLQGTISHPFSTPKPLLKEKHHLLIQFLIPIWSNMSYHVIGDGFCKVRLCKGNLKPENVSRFLTPCKTCTSTKNITDCQKLLEFSNESLEEYLDSINQSTGNDSDATSVVSDVVLQKLLRLLMHTAKGLQYLHDNNIIHCDIKSTNVKIFHHSCHDKVTAKLGGFQSSVKLELNKTKETFGYQQNSLPNTSDQDEGPPNSNLTTESIIAYEHHVRNERNSKTSDIFDLGILFYYTLTNKRNPFWSTLNQDKSKIKIKQEYAIKLSTRNRASQSLEKSTAQGGNQRNERSTANEENQRSETNPSFSLIRNSKMLTEQRVTVADMIRRMIDRDLTKRLRIEDVLCHPSFYDDEKKLKFLLTVHETTKAIFPFENVVTNGTKSNEKLSFNMKNCFLLLNAKEKNTVSMEACTDTCDKEKKEKYNENIKDIDQDLNKTKNEICNLKKKLKLYIENIRFNTEINMHLEILIKDDVESSKKIPFDIHEKYCCVKQYEYLKDPNKGSGNWQSVQVSDVQSLLQVLRDKVYHACDLPPIVPDEFPKHFTSSKDTYKPEIFLEVFISKWPALLVHLYEVYRNKKDCANNFYPPKKLVNGNGENAQPHEIHSNPNTSFEI